MSARASEVVLRSRFEELKTAVASREPLLRLHRFFAAEAIGSWFNYTWLDNLIGKVSNPDILVERIEGNRGCLVHSLPYRAKTKGKWFKMSSFTFQLVNGVWIITNNHFSISAHHNTVEGKDICLALGWPWE